MRRTPPNRPLVIVLGATGTGKSQLAVDLALRYNGEIINGDAMQMYTGLPIVTNKITPAEQQGVPHHLIGNVSLDEEPWHVGVFKRKAEGIIEEIRSRGRLPILVGGTHYYTQSLLFDDHLIEDTDEKIEPPQDGNPEIDECSRNHPILAASTEEILAKLREVDPVMADRWHPKDRRRIQRSLEIYLTQGQKASDVYAKQRERKSAPRQDGVSPNLEEQDRIISLESTILFWVHAGQKALKSRLDARVDKMVENGLIEEVQTLQKLLELETAASRPPDLTRGIWVSIGFKEFSPYLSTITDPATTEKDKSKALALSIEQTKAATRQYAKRQVRWIRLKLLIALKKADSLRNLYLLDGSDVSNFNHDVSGKAIKVCGDFLSGLDLSPPTEMSPAAAEFLTPSRDFDFGDRPDLWIRQTCDVCNVTAVTEANWNFHMQSRGHRGKLRKLNRPPRVPRQLQTEATTNGAQLEAIATDLGSETTPKDTPI
ncbi:hypothetical protein VE01_02352 [Pseudogymnoascus verrucosus]|uniref:tRNA dimethylallyltransferase n=1 Tax=Pseudogymnoascus verrucosus TaxID=342668 RepID=A0A1B8GT14_9PEZI|nr:uncharacterized protein VE01_02352 [Pseudogymnoascus verrucosus]OBT98973.1 hypothetical protein VE01_02352 [Pseudogymnoascus verrucosus]